MHLLDIVKYLEALDTCSIDCNSFDYSDLCQDLIISSIKN